MACPWARTARWRALSATRCTTESVTSTLGAQVVATGGSVTKHVAFVSSTTCVNTNLSRRTARSAVPANGDFTSNFGVSPTR